MKQDEWLRVGGVKGFADGSLGFDGPLLRAVQRRSEELRRLQRRSDSALTHGGAGARRGPRGTQVEIHAIGDRANARSSTSMSGHASDGPKDRRFRIEHAQHLRPEDIPRFAKIPVIASMQPYHAIDDGRWAQKRIGDERCRTTYAFRSLLDTGAKLAFGSDWDVAPLSPIAGIGAAVTRRTLDGKNPGGWFPEQRISVREALRAYEPAALMPLSKEKDEGARVGLPR